MLQRMPINILRYLLCDGFFYSIDHIFFLMNMLLHTSRGKFSKIFSNLKFTLFIQIEILVLVFLRKNITIFSRLC